MKFVIFLLTPVCFFLKLYNVMPSKFQRYFLYVSQQNGTVIVQDDNRRSETNLVGFFSPVVSPDRFGNTEEIFRIEVQKLLS